MGRPQTLTGAVEDAHVELLAKSYELGKHDQFGLVVWLLSVLVQAPQPTPTAIVVPCDAPGRVCAQPIGGVTPLAAPTR
ncbi:MAG TPA: hypothetical protein QGF35_06450 [Dehalococcoidia bacterium]|jgi:hypothetical protein|nr:hypothetical protein [Dehalococcoidia bacterium]